MNKDAIILTLVVAVVLAAGAVFFLFTQEDEEAAFTPADANTAGEELLPDARTKGPARTPRKVGEFADAKRWDEGTGAVVIANPNLDEELAADIAGQVVNGAGEGVPDAIVALCVDIGNARVLSVLGEVRTSAKTDEKGFYRINSVAVDDRYAIRVEAENYASKIEQCVTLDAGETRKQNFQLSSGYELKGLVVDSEDTPIAGARLLISDQATRSADPEMDIEKIATTDENGEFVCRGLNIGMKRISCMASGFGTLTKLGTQILQGKETPPIQFKLHAGGVSFSGQVVDSDDALAIEGVIVRAQPIRTGRLNIPSLNYPPVKTDVDGVFSFEGLQPGSYRMRFFGGKGYAASGMMRTAKVPNQAEMIVKLDREPTAIGEVVDAETGQPIKRFKIYFARSKTLIMASPQLSQKFEDEQGKFEYTGVQTKPRTMNKFYLHATAKGYAGGASKELTINGREDIEGVRIEMYRGAVVTGKVVDSSGNPVNNAEIDLVPQMGAPNSNQNAGLFGALISNGTRTTRRKGRTNEKGEFRIESVAEGWYKLNANHNRFADTASESSIEVGRSGEYEFPPQILMKGGTIKGRVLTKDGNPEKGARVRVQMKGGLGGGAGYNKQTDSAGRFEIHNIRPGIYRVTVVERGGQIDLGSMFTQALNTPTEITVGDGSVQDVGDL